MNITGVTRYPLPPLTIGVMGAAGGELDPEVCLRMRNLFVVGISPALNLLNLEEHVNRYHSPTRGYNAIIYTGSGLMGREIENIRSCDVVIFAEGRSGTLGELAIAYDEGKVIRGS